MIPVAFGPVYTAGMPVDAAELRCPDCERNEECYSHPYEVAVNRGGDLTITTGDEPPRAVRSLPVGRGTLIVLRFVCELSGNYWCLKLQFHKGRTLVWSEIEQRHADLEAWPRTFWRD